MEAKSPNCGICEQRSLSVPAEIWCNDCEEGLCGSCRDHHGLSKSSRNHKTIKLNDYLELSPFLQDIKLTCENHDDSFQMFCKEHEVPCCRKCIINTHKTCELAILDDMVSNVKTSVAFVELEQTVNDLVNNIRKIIENRENNIKNLNTQKEEIKKRIKDKKDEIINHLNKLEDKLVRELEEKAKKEETQIQEYIQTARQKETEIAEYNKMLNTIKEHTSDLQCFLASKQIEEKISVLENSTRSVDTSSILNERQLSFEYDKTAIDIESSFKRLGTISVVESPADLQLLSKKSKAAQFGTSRSATNNIETLTLKIENTFSTGCKSISGLTVIPDGIVYSTAYSAKTIVCIDRQGSNIFTIQTTTDAFDVEYIPSLHVIAVSSGGNYPNRITLINLTTKQESGQSYALPSFVYGMALKENKLFCGVQGEQAISFFDIFYEKSQCGKVKIKEKIAYQYKIACYHGHIYFTNIANNRVTCFDDSGEVVWSFQNPKLLSSPSGIAVDVNGIVYVAGRNSSNIVAISPDGKKHKELLSKTNGIDRPQAVHYDANKNELLVANIQNTIFICSLCFS